MPAGGGNAAFVEEDWLVLARAGHAERLVPLASVPLACGGRAGFQVENVLAAALAALELGLPGDAIRAGLESFGASATAPGRFNLFEHNGATVVVDYAHNASALSAVVEALDHFPRQGKRSAVFSGCNCRDDDLVRQGTLLGAGFDRIVLFADRGYYGREDGELNQLLRRGIAAASPARACEILEFAKERDAVEAALDDVHPGDVVLLGVSAIDRCLELVRDWMSEGSGRGVTSPR